MVRAITAAPFKPLRVFTALRALSAHPLPPGERREAALLALAQDIADCSRQGSVALYSRRGELVVRVALKAFPTVITQAVGISFLRDNLKAMGMGLSFTEVDTTSVLETLSTEPTETNPTAASWQEEEEVPRLRKIREEILAAKDPAQAIDIIESNRAQLRCLPNKSVYTMLNQPVISLIRSIEGPGARDELLVRLAALFPRDIYIWNERLQNCQEPSLAQKIFAGLLTVLTPNNFSYGTLIKIYADNFDAPRARAAFEDMKRSDVQPSEYIYNTLIGLYLKLDKEAEAEALFREMNQNGIPPNEHTYNFLMDNLRRDGHLMQHLLKYLVLAGDHYRTVVVLFRLKKFQAGLAYLGKNMPHGPAALALRVKGYRGLRQYDQAERVLSEAAVCEDLTPEERIEISSEKATLALERFRQDHDSYNFCLSARTFYDLLAGQPLRAMCGILLLLAEALNNNVPFSSEAGRIIDRLDIQQYRTVLSAKLKEPIAIGLREKILHALNAFDSARRRAA